MQFNKITEVERMAGMSRLTPSDLAEISAAISHFRAQAEELRQREAAAQEEQARIRREEAARAEQRRQQDAAAEAERAKARQEELAAIAREEEQAFQTRLTKFSAPVRTFVTRNPGVAKMNENEAGTVLIAFYTMEVALRVCGTKFGGYRSELTEMTSRRKLFEQTLNEVHSWPDSRLKDARTKAGVDSGTGPMAEMLSADRFRLMQTCDSALAYTSSVLNFER
jgi:flagellar biosynthesis GTPase FlhF